MKSLSIKNYTFPFTFNIKYSNVNSIYLRKKKENRIDLKIAEKNFKQFYQIREVNKKLLSRSKRTNYKARGRLYLLLRKVGYLTTQ